MAMLDRRSVLAALVAAMLVGCAQLTPEKTAAPEPAGAWLNAVRAGGHVIIIRHGATHNDQADTDPLNIENTAKQRQLNDRGRQLAREIGESFRKLNIPVGEVYSSKFYRAQETARLAFGKTSPTFDVSEGGQVVSPNENNRRAAAMRKMAGTMPAPGTNTVIVTHKPNIMDAFGKDWFDVKEGEASIFKVDPDGKYHAVRRVLAEDWAKLAAAS